ncbi:MAG TPA: hypothetical protein VLV76_24570 [Candidatus Acidoferrum sp.]|nr:hypothetical protein [Candidatus Acidoferrum sp.]
MSNRKILLLSGLAMLAACEPQLPSGQYRLALDDACGRLAKGDFKGAS